MYTNGKLDGTGSWMGSESQQYAVLMFLLLFLLLFCVVLCCYVVTRRVGVSRCMKYILSTSTLLPAEDGLP